MKLYHFLSKEYTFEALRNKRIKVSIINILNDPFEFQAGFSNPNQEIEALFTKFKDRISKKYGILCFSKDWSNPLLWSHYAKKHTGFALGFELPDDAAIKVKYRKARPLFPCGKLPLPQDDPRVNPFLEKLIRTKFSSWAYEEEVRFSYLLSELDLENALYFRKFDNKLILKEVIAGCRSMPSEELASLLDGFENITVIKARMDSNRYQIIPH